MDRKARSCSRTYALRRTVALLLPAALGVMLAGCSLFVMGGKMLMGDPLIDAPFKQATKTSLPKSGKKVAVICVTPESVKEEFSSLDLDLLAQVTRRLKQAEIEVIPPHLVATWIDDNGGDTQDVSDLAEAVKADYVIRIDLETFTHYEDNSPTLFRGHSSGTVSVFEQKGKRGHRQSEEVFRSGFNSTYPPQRPIPVQDVSESVFRKRFLDRVSDELAHLFFDHKVGNDI